MNKREVVTPIIVTALTLAFAFICIMVFLSKGKSAKWVSRKMKIGGLLLSLTAIVQKGCRTNHLCYKSADQIPSISDAEFKLTTTRKNQFTGKLKMIHPIFLYKKGYAEWQSKGYDSTIINEELKPLLSVEKIKELGPTEFNYELINYKTNKIIINGHMVPVDGKFNSMKKEKFRINLDKTLRRGKYLLKIYYKNLYTQEIFNYPDPFKIEIGSEIIKIKK